MWEWLNFFLLSFLRPPNAGLIFFAHHAFFISFIGFFLVEFLNFLPMSLWSIPVNYCTSFLICFFLNDYGDYFVCTKKSTWGKLLKFWGRSKAFPSEIVEVKKCILSVRSDITVCWLSREFLFELWSRFDLLDDYPHDSNDYIQKQETIVPSNMSC